MVKLYREDLIFYLLRENIDKDKINEIISNFNEKDWEKTGDFLKNNGLFSLFYDRALNLKLENIPEIFLARLEKLYLRNIQRNTFLERELFNLTDCLRQCNISVIPLKGVILSELLYNDIALRGTSNDIDLLVPYERLKEAEEKILEIGYSFTDKEDTIYLNHKTNKEIVLHKKVNSGYVLLDLHWYITDERLSDNYLMEFRANAKEVNLKGHQVLIPSTEDLIFYLSLHAINYGHFVTIKYLYDLHRMVILYNKKIDWPEVVRKAKENKLEKILFYSLSFSRDFFETPVPEEVLKATEPCFVKDLFVRQWLNKDNILKRGEYIISSWIWEFFVSNLLYTDNFFDYLELIVNRRFLPVENYFEFSYKEQHMPPGIYLKKLLLKGLKCFFKIGNRVYG